MSAKHSKAYGRRPEGAHWSLSSPEAFRSPSRVKRVPSSVLLLENTSFETSLSNVLLVFAKVIVSRGWSIWVEIDVQNTSRPDRWFGKFRLYLDSSKRCFGSNENCDISAQTRTSNCLLISPFVVCAVMKTLTLLLLVALAMQVVVSTSISNGGQLSIPLYSLGASLVLRGYTANVEGVRRRRRRSRRRRSPVYYFPLMG